MKNTAITLMGMSGTGKTHWTRRLAEWGWNTFDCDYQIGTKYLQSELKVPPGTDRAGNMAIMAEFIGKIGGGALDMKEFQRRQKLYNEAEKKALDDVPILAITAAREHKNFVNDSTGSLCEIEDERLIAEVAKHTKFVYLKSDVDHDHKIIARARTHPKSLYFPPAKFDGWLADYMIDCEHNAVDQVDPDLFSAWVFPKLYQSRLPKYQKLADKYGITVPVAALRDVNSEEEFLKIINQ